MKLDESLLNRRDFLDGLAASGVLVCTGVAGEMVLGYLTGQDVPEPTEPQLVSSTALETLEARQFVLVPYGPSPVMIFRLPDGELRALAAVCTHGQCNVRYRPAENDIFCACHEGRFTADGVNVPGTPPPRPLRKFHLSRKTDGSLLVFHEPFDADEAPAEPDPTGEG